MISEDSILRLRTVIKDVVGSIKIAQQEQRGEANVLMRVGRLNGIMEAARILLTDEQLSELEELCKDTTVNQK